MKSLSHFLVFTLLTWGVCHAQSTPRHQLEDGFGGDVTMDYDGSRHRTGAMHGGLDVEWTQQTWWAKLSFDAYTDASFRLSHSKDFYGSLSLGTALYKDHKERLYINALIDVSGPSVLADKGVDITAEINIAKGLTKDWWIGGDLSQIFSTSSNPGNFSGYTSLTAFVMWFSRWLPNDNDSFKFSIWAATNEVPQDNNALFLSLEYEFNITDSIDASIGIGTDPSTPWDHKGVYGTAGLRWSF